MSRQQRLPLSAWPLADRTVWVAASTAVDVLDDGGDASHLAPRSRDDLERRYAYFLDWAERRGHMAIDGSAAATVTPEAIAAYIGDPTLVLSSVTRAGSVRKIARVAALLAPRQDWAWLDRIAARLEARMVPASKHARVILADDLLNSDLS